MELVEGRARLLVPAGNKDRGPGTHDSAVFFNPAMALSRDLSVLALDAWAAPKGWTALDGLAASGARAVRFAVEVPRVAVTANDWNPVAADLARANAERNGVKVEVSRRSFGSLLWESQWDWVDVDPFGSPAEFVDAACRAVRDRGVLALTATDATALHGVYRDVCERRYLATPMRCEFGHEAALRILAGFAQRTAAKHDLALTPLLAHATDHYYRVYLTARRGAARANAVLKGMGYAVLCKACGHRAILPERASACPACAAREVLVGGPLWGGPLDDADALAAIAAKLPAHAGTLARREDVEELLELLAEEARAPPLFFDLHHASSRAGVDVPRTEAAFAALRAAGHVAARTHVSNRGLKTDATARELSEALRGARTRA